MGFASVLRHLHDIVQWISHGTSCRLTWEIIKRHRHDRAIVLTTHSMEEVRALCRYAKGVRLAFYVLIHSSPYTVSYAVWHHRLQGWRSDSQQTEHASVCLAIMCCGLHAQALQPQHMIARRANPPGQVPNERQHFLYQPITQLRVLLYHRRMYGATAWRSCRTAASRRWVLCWASIEGLRRSIAIKTLS